MKTALQLKEKKEILNFINNLSETAKKEKWVSHYDVDSDSLVIRTPQLSKDARKRYINNEFAFYLTKKDVEGIFIEYFKSNFIPHHKDIKSLIKSIKSKKKQEAIIELNKSETKKLVPELESVILDSLIGVPEKQGI